MMSDDDRDIDIESDAENDSDSRTHARNSAGGSGYYSQAEKRAHHNALERRRRDHIKDSFTSLREAVPALQNEKVASRAQILKKSSRVHTIYEKKKQFTPTRYRGLKKTEQYPGNTNTSIRKGSAVWQLFRCTRIRSRCKIRRGFTRHGQF